MDDKATLTWLHDRMINVYGESANVDFLHRLRGIIKDTPKSKTTPGSYDLKDDPPKSDKDIIKDLDLVTIPENMIPGCPEQYPGIKIYRTYQLPKLDSEDLFETYERTMLVHPAAGIAVGDMVKREDLELCS